MTDGIITTDEVVLDETTQILAQGAAMIRERFERAFSDMAGLSGEWDDEDFLDLQNALAAYRTELDALEEKTNELIVKAKTKIEMIHSLHKMDI